MRAVRSQVRIGVALALIAAISVAIYLAAGLGRSVLRGPQAYGACFTCGEMLLCRIDVVNDGDSMLTIQGIELGVANRSVALTPLYNYTSMPGRSHARLVIRVSGGSGTLVLTAPRYRIETQLALSGEEIRVSSKPRSIFNETWVSPEGGLEGFYPIMLEHRGLVTGPGEAAYLVVQASAINGNLTRLHVKLYAFHDELVYEEVREGQARQHRLVVPLYYFGYEAMSGATSLLVSYRLSGGSDAMLVVEVEAWRTLPVEARISILTGSLIKTYLPLIPGSIEPGACWAPQGS